MPGQFDRFPALNVEGCRTDDHPYGIGYNTEKSFCSIGVSFPHVPIIGVARPRAGTTFQKYYDLKTYTATFRTFACQLLRAVFHHLLLGVTAAAYISLCKPPYRVGVHGNLGVVPGDGRKIISASAQHTSKTTVVPFTGSGPKQSNPPGTSPWRYTKRTMKCCGVAYSTFACRQYRRAPYQKCSSVASNCYGMQKMSRSAGGAVEAFGAALDIDYARSEEAKVGRNGTDLEAESEATGGVSTRSSGATRNCGEGLRSELLGLQLIECATEMEEDLRAQVCEP